MPRQLHIPFPPLLPLPELLTLGELLEGNLRFLLFLGLPVVIPLILNVLIVGGVLPRLQDFVGVVHSQ